jgi:D-sedoheptulose 7-phosphate isomerase
MADRIARRLREAAAAQSKLPARAADLRRAASLLVETLRAGGRVLVFGNGGSASDALHLAAELEGRFLRERRPLPVLCLNANVSTLTAISNDYGYEQSFARQVRAHARAGDVVVAISTSGASKNVLAAAKEARALGARVIGMTGEKGGPLRALCDVALCAPSSETPRIQECHVVMLHVLCEAVEESI